MSYCDACRSSGCHHSRRETRSSDPARYGREMDEFASRTWVDRAVVARERRQR